jgi:hypothetical protein
MSRASRSQDLPVPGLPEVAAGPSSEALEERTTMPAPKADPVKCDLLGCGHLAHHCTDGTEKDSTGLGRKAVPNINVCLHHENYPFSEDAQRFAQSDQYKQRK